MKRLQAKVLRSGIAMGKAFVIESKPKIEKRTIDDVQAEENKLQKALEQLKANMQNEAEKADQYAKNILEAHLEMLEDPAYIDEIKKGILGNKYNAEYAALSAGEFLALGLEFLDNEYLRERSEDIRQVATRLAETISGNTTEIKLTEQVILVSEEFTPALLAALDKDLVLAIVANKGSQSSHTAILANNYGLPYLKGIDPEVVENGQTVIVDGEESCFILDPDAEAIELAQRKIEEEEALLKNAFLETKMKVYANISSIDDVENALKYGADGIGLFRTEFLFMNRKSAPTEEEQFTAYKTVLEKMAGKRVVIRTIDVGTDKPVDYLNMGKEENPALGFRGIRVSLKYTNIFRIQLRALFRAAVYGNLGIMFPMITSVREVAAIDEQIKLVEEELKKDGVDHKIPQIGVMVETPAAALVAKELSEMVNFFSLGTNDLTQYTLALDRQAAGLDDYYDPHHQGIFKLIAETIFGAHEKDVHVSVCGELGSDETAIPKLVEMGLDGVSVGAAVIPKVRSIIAKTEKSLAEDNAALQVQDKIAENEKINKNEISDESDEMIVSPVDGEFIAMEDIPDKVFAEGVLGPCFAIRPANGNIKAPISGKVVNIANTKHAIVIRSDLGTEVLVHIGIDTVKLNGVPFAVKVKEDERVEKGQLLVEVDLEYIEKAGYSTITPVIICN